MIITQEILQQVFPNDPDMVSDIAALGLPQDYSTLISQLQNLGGSNGNTELLSMSLPKLIQASGNFTYGQYQVKNITTDEFIQFTTLAEAQAQVLVNTPAAFAMFPERFSVNEEMSDVNGNLSWKPVDISVLPTLPDGIYQVYDFKNNSYSQYTTTATAVSALENLKNLLSSDIAPIQQQIISSDGTETAWVAAQ